MKTLMWMVSAKEREDLSLDSQVRLACDRLGFNVDELTESEQEQVYSRLGLHRLWCVDEGCSQNKWVLITDETTGYWCPTHERN